MSVQTNVVLRSPLNHRHIFLSQRIENRFISVFLTWKQAIASHWILTYCWMKSFTHSSKSDNRLSSLIAVSLVNHEAQFNKCELNRLRSEPTRVQCFSAFSLSLCAIFHIILIVWYKMRLRNQRRVQEWLEQFFFIILANGNATKCYGPLGCLEINEDWYGITRPVNDLPQEREIVNTQFHLYTKNDPVEVRNDVLF